MKVFSSILLLSLAAIQSVSAQGFTFFSSPPSGTTVAAGSDLTVTLIREDGLSSYQEDSVVFGLQICGSGCPSPADELGIFLTKALFDPVPPNNTAQPEQSFTMTIPSFTPKGPTQLGLVHFFFIGAGLSATIGTSNITLNIV